MRPGDSAPSDRDTSLLRIDRLVGVYDADGSITGELRYLVRSRLGKQHCALCDVTHGAVREKSEWRRCRNELPVEMATVHLDEQGARLSQFTDGHTPCVVAETGEDLVMLVDPEAIEACAGSPECLARTISTRAEALGLRLD